MAGKEVHMHGFKRFLGKVCDKCAFCKYARQNPDTPVGRLMAWHGKWCPVWKAQQELEQQRSQSS
jgi:hypothetical protein